jgi:hypothetical protein
LFTNNWFWQAKQSIPFYADCVKKREDFAPNFGDKAPSHTSFFTREFSTKNNVTVVPRPPCFSPVPQLKSELKGRHFDKIGVI